MTNFSHGGKGRTLADEVAIFKAIAPLVTYDRDGGRFFWAVSRRGQRGGVGSPAGTLNKKTGYYYLSHQNRRVLLHRFVWWMENGMPEEVTGVIDHKDRDTKNCRWWNLQQTDQAGNMANVDPEKRKRTIIPVPPVGKTGERYISLSRKRNKLAADSLGYVVAVPVGDGSYMKAWPRDIETAIQIRDAFLAKKLAATFN